MKCEGRIRERGPPAGAAEASGQWRVGPRAGTPARALGLVLQRGAGPGRAALTSEHYAKPPSLLAASARRGPPLPDPYLFLPQQPWGHHFPEQTLVEPSWSQAGMFPPGSPCHPTPRQPPNLGFNVYFLIRMPATREPPGGPSAGEGRWEGLSTLSCPHLHRAEDGLPGPAGPPVPPLRVSDLMRVAFFVYKLHPPARPQPTPQLTLPAASSPQEVKSIFIFRMRLFLPEKGKSWKRF